MKKAETYSTIHPGEVLDLTLKERGIAQKEFASTIGMPASVLNAIINKKRSVTPDIAVLLEAALDKEATFWINHSGEDRIGIQTIRGQRYSRS